MKKLILILMLFSCYDALYSQVVQEWAKRFNGAAGPEEDWQRDMVVDASGNIYVTGYAYISYTPYVRETATVKYSPDGVRLWTAKCTDTSSVYALAVDASGNVYIAGSHPVNGGLIVKYNSAGVQQWKIFPPNLHVAEKIAIDAAGSVYVAGFFASDMVTLKLNPSGVELWRKTVSDPFSGTADGIKGFEIDPMGNVLILLANYPLFKTVKYSPSGTQLWLNEQSSLRYGSLAVDASGNAYITGYMFIPDQLDSIITTKYNSSGSLVWKKNFTGPNSWRYGYSVAKVKPDAAGNVYVSGMRTNSATGLDVPALVKYSSSGNLLWSQVTTIMAQALIVDAAGNSFFADSSSLAKYNSSGVHQWNRTYPGVDYARPEIRIKLDNTGNVIVAGASSSPGSGLDFQTAKYSSAGLYQWNTAYQVRGSDYDEARSMVVDNSGYTVVSGIITGISSGKDMGVVRYNSAGAVHWSATHNGTANGDDKVNASVIDASGNIYITGVAINTSSGADYATIKYNSTGVRQWVALYNGTGNGSDEARSVAVDNSGNVYVTGSSQGPAGMDYATVKYNSNGTQQWAQRYNGPANGTDDAYSLALDAAGNIYVTGSCTGNTSGLDYTTVKYNSAGAFQWASIFNGTGNLGDIALALKTDASGNVYVTGWSTRTASDLEYVTIKYNSSGVQQWLGRYNGTGGAQDMASALAIDAAGNVYVTGSSVGLGTSTDYATVKYNASGIQQWASRYNGPANSGDGARSIAVDALGNIYVTGSSNGTSSSSDFATIKYNSSGTQLWATRYDGPGTGGVDGAVSVAVDASFKVYVAGLSFGSNSNTYDFAVVKYLQTGTSGRTLNELPAEFDLTQNYPNPFNPSTTIKFALPVGGVTTLKVYDIAGKEIASLVETDLEAGYHEVNFNASELASGVYFYRITSGSFTDVKKMMLVK
ncbi:MAG: SBBP repeat-containing protein [Ignavibacteria bacterium]|nr:SBBP repeat-containing protein [Ignavibacteria bacterium]